MGKIKTCFNLQRRTAFNKMEHGAAGVNLTITNMMTKKTYGEYGFTWQAKMLSHSLATDLVSIKVIASLSSALSKEFGEVMQVW